jgi:hypothetical protein
MRRIYRKNDNSKYDMPGGKYLYDNEDYYDRRRIRP